MSDRFTGTEVVAWLTELYLRLMKSIDRKASKKGHSDSVCGS